MKFWIFLSIKKIRGRKLHEHAHRLEVRRDRSSVSTSGFSMIKVKTRTLLMLLGFAACCNDYKYLKTVRIVLVLINDLRHFV